MEKALERRPRTARQIEEAELRLVEAVAKRAEDRVQNEGRREELAVAREEIALGSDLLERRRRRTVLAREVAGLAKDAAVAALWIVVAAALVLSVLIGERDTALTILCVLAGRSGVSILRVAPASGALLARRFKRWRHRALGGSHPASPPKPESDSLVPVAFPSSGSARD
jgi:hypothetical protein